MFRALVFATLLASAPVASSLQPPSVLHIKVVVTDAAGTATPVPRYLLLISDNPPASSPRRVMTALDGTADVRLRPGNYTVESDQPFAFQGKTYSWVETLDVGAGRDTVLELSAGNAEIASADSPVSSSVETESAMLLARWQDSVVSVWTPTMHASGFVVDARGLVATSHRAVGASTSVQVQLTPAVKLAATVLATNQERDGAILWIDAKAAAASKPVPLDCGRASQPETGQRVITIGATRRQLKRMTSGILSGRAAHLISTDLMIGVDSVGGPVFSVAGELVGLGTLLAQEADADARVVPATDLCELLTAAEKKMNAAAAPSGTLLPVESPQPLPGDALKEAARNRAARPVAYRMTSADFEIAFITPVVNYAVQNPSDEERRRQSYTRSRPAGEPVLDPLENFSNWSGYVADVPPVLLVRVTPKFVEGFWTKVARGAAQTQGVSLPPIKAFKSGFSQLRAYCADAEIEPIHPFKLEQRISEAEAIYEGLYAFDPGALTPSCGSVKLVLYSEKEPAKGDSRMVDPKVLQQIHDDFEPFRARR